LARSKTRFGNTMNGWPNGPAPEGAPGGATETRGGERSPGRLITEPEELAPSHGARPRGRGAGSVAAHLGG
jgi:hypothetical protein